jgi:hypothetical protein
VYTSAQMSFAAEPPRHAPIEFWRVALAFITTFFNLFGAPEEIAAGDTLTAKTHAQIVRWLRAGEAYLRRLLLIEAAALTPNIEKPVLGRRKTRRVRKLRYFTADKPEQWRVSFRCIVHRNIPNQETRRKAERKGEPVRFYSAWPLAERAEALLRAYNNPAPHAQRLANALYKRPHKARTLLDYPDDAPNLVGDDAFAETQLLAEGAVKRIDPG